MKRLLNCILLISLIFALVSCSDTSTPPEIKEEIPKEEEIPVYPDTPVEPTLPEIPEIDPTLTEISLTTGLPCTPEVKASRPIAVMINNNEISLPQSAISMADIVYECDAEGGVTRLMAIYSDWKNISEIGSIRSARDYFIPIALSHSAIYVHAGGSPSAYEVLGGDVDNLDGVNMYTIPENTFYRDRDRLKDGYEHSMMTTGENILTASKLLRYDLEYDSDFDGFFPFGEMSLEEGDEALRINIKHSSYINVRFDYNEDENKYYKYSFGAPHTDALNDEHISFENVFVLFVEQRVVDEIGRLDVKTTGKGDGLYLVSGKCYDVTWQRDDEDDVFEFYYNGEEITLTPGKTHITLFNKNRKDNVSINNTEDSPWGLN